MVEVSCEIVLIWMSLDFTDDQSALVQVMAWCRQPASHYLSPCWPRSLSPYHGITRPLWVDEKFVCKPSLWRPVLNFLGGWVHIRSLLLCQRPLICFIGLIDGENPTDILVLIEIWLQQGSRMYWIFHNNPAHVDGCSITGADLQHVQY